MDKVYTDQLYEKIDDVKSRKGPGGFYSYVAWQDVANRMNQVFGMGWSSSSELISNTENEVVVKVRVMVFDYDSNTMLVQEGFGGAQKFGEVGNPFKSAYSKGLKDACKKWGVGLFIDEEDGSNDHLTSQKQVKGSSKPESSAPPKQQDSGNTPPPPPPPDNSTKQNNYSPVETMGNTQKTEEKSNNNSANKSNGMPLPPGVNMGSSSNQELSNKGPNSNENPQTETNSTGNSTVKYISDIQKAALSSILEIGNIDYSTLANEAFENRGIVKNPIPSMDELTYEDAVVVVKYGNDKFRN